MKKSKFSALKVFLGMEVSLESMTLGNGTKIEAESFEPGEGVFIVSEDGNVALPVGDYTLEDGRTLVVSEEGIIGEIKEAEPAEEETEQPAEEVEASQDVQLADLVARIEALEAKLADKPTEELSAQPEAPEQPEQPATELSAEVEEVNLEVVNPSPEATISKKTTGFKYGPSGKKRSGQERILEMLYKNN